MTTIAAKPQGDTMIYLIQSELCVRPTQITNDLKKAEEQAEKLETTNDAFRVITLELDDIETIVRLAITPKK